MKRFSSNANACQWVSQNYGLAEKLAELEEPWYRENLPDDLRKVHSQMKHQGAIVPVSSEPRDGYTVHTWQMSRSAREKFENTPEPTGGILPCGHPGVKNVSGDDCPHDLECPICEGKYMRSEVDA